MGEIDHSMTKTDAHMPANTAAILQELFMQHQESSRRDSTDQGNNAAALRADNDAIRNAREVAGADGQILALLKNGQAIPQDLYTKAVGLHQTSIKFDSEDQSGDKDAIAKDRRDIKEEDSVIKADQALLGLNVVSSKLQQKLEEDIKSKQHLQSNEREDAADEPLYARHDADDIKINKQIIEAMTQGKAGLAELLRDDLKSKAIIVHDRRQDSRKEPRYSKDDAQDMVLNAQLLAELGKDPYIQALQNDH